MDIVVTREGPRIYAYGKSPVGAIEREDITVVVAACVSNYDPVKMVMLLTEWGYDSEQREKQKAS